MIFSICGEAFSSRAASGSSDADLVASACDRGATNVSTSAGTAGESCRGSSERCRSTTSRERADLVDAEAAVERDSDLGHRPVEQTRLEVGVGGIERELCGEPVGDLEGGVEPRLDGPLAQQRRREGVDRLDVRAVEAGEGAVDVAREPSGRSRARARARAPRARGSRARLRRPR